MIINLTVLLGVSLVAFLAFALVLLLPLPRILKGGIAISALIAGFCFQGFPIAYEGGVPVLWAGMSSVVFATFIVLPEMVQHSLNQNWSRSLWCQLMA